MCADGDRVGSAPRADIRSLVRIAVPSAESLSVSADLSVDAQSMKIDQPASIELDDGAQSLDIAVPAQRIAGKIMG